MDQNTKSVIDNGIATNPRMTHATVGVLIGFEGGDRPLVAFSNNSQATAILYGAITS